MTLANRITSGRFLLSFLVFVALALVGRWPAHDRALYDAAIALFLVAALLDILDGYVARKYREVTEFGRIADPLADKIIVCGTYTLFLGIPAIAQHCRPWMVVVVVSREFVVHGLRSVAEARGIPFGATFWGKQKMFVQCFAATAAMITAAHLFERAWAWTTTEISMWAMTLSTVVSGAVYVADARRVLR